MKDEKYDTQNLLEGFPTLCDDKTLKKVIQDLTSEFDKKIKSGKDNKYWEKLISSHKESANNELELRLQSKKINKFSMDNPLIFIIVTLLVALIIYFFESDSLNLKMNELIST